VVDPATAADFRRPHRYRAFQEGASNSPAAATWSLENRPVTPKDRRTRKARPLKSFSGRALRGGRCSTGGAGLRCRQGRAATLLVSHCKARLKFGCELVIGKEFDFEPGG
jgi:hypothetical protein